VLFALGWHPQKISGLLQFKYSKGEQWGPEWEFYNPSTRADFYTRALTGAIVTGADTLDDFDCVSMNQLGYCSNVNCNELEKFRTELFKKGLPYE
jgi:hypothetical protein